RRRHHSVHGRGHQRELEPVRVDLPGDVHVVGVARPARRNDGHLVEPVGSPGRLADADLDVHADAPPRPFRYSDTANARPGKDRRSGRACRNVTSERAASRRRDRAYGNANTYSRPWMFAGAASSALPMYTLPFTTVGDELTIGSWVWPRQICVHDAWPQGVALHARTSLVFRPA